MNKRTNRRLLESLDVCYENEIHRPSIEPASLKSFFHTRISLHYFLISLPNLRHVSADLGARNRGHASFNKLPLTIAGFCCRTPEEMKSGSQETVNSS